MKNETNGKSFMRYHSEKQAIKIEKTIDHVDRIGNLVNKAIGKNKKQDDSAGQDSEQPTLEVNLKEIAPSE
eukprot:CAMPEP_0168626656 /NCGR_PEP_ID=MMETSP0449_2-20121227/10759_1 /TAXON_ID=1082188 /ORGANISM="Strombidium rassoulzadegani, Strain ras09" /LENGTH=70 /DNA_ID=CAMNT_0008668687 /DNA_START=161 /DNA_END=373 /DNA_ORIENTATION=-